MSARKSGSAPTINDVAALAGVSKKTVSRVINNSPLLRPETREKVQKAIASLDFSPNPQARALAFRKNFLIVLLHDNPNAQTVLNFQRGVLSAIVDSDLAFAVRPVDRTSPSMLADIENFMVRQRPLGVMILPPVSERDDLAELCQRLQIRYVRIGSAPLDMATRCVSSNDRDVVAQVSRMLIARGHRRIGFVRGPVGFRSAAEREAGFRAALSEQAIDADPALFAEGTYRFQSGIEAGHLLLGRDPRPTAILASNDEMAAGVMRAARIMGLDLPRDLSVMGFDDSPTASHLWPALSTIHWPIEEMGRLAARKLVPEFLPDEVEEDLPGIVPSSIVERDSVAEVD